MCLWRPPHQLATDVNDRLVDDDPVALKINRPRPQRRQFPPTQSRISQCENQIGIVSALRSEVNDLRMRQIAAPVPRNSRESQAGLVWRRPSRIASLKIPLRTNTT